MGGDASSILFGDTMVPNIDEDDILLLGYSILYKKYYLTRFNHQKKTLLNVGGGGGRRYQQGRAESAIVKITSPC